MSENNRDEDRKNANSLFIQRFKSLLAVNRDGGAYFQLGEGGGACKRAPEVRACRGIGGNPGLPIYRIPCQEFGESHFPSSCQIPYTVQKFSLFPKPHSISVNSRYPIILLQTLLNVYTAISRKVVGKNVHAIIPKGNLRYD